MSNFKAPLASLESLDRKAKVEALLDRYLEGVDFRGGRSAGSRAAVPFRCQKMKAGIVATGTLR